MKIAFTFRNFEPTDSIKRYATHKVGKLQKYLHAPAQATLTFAVERHRHCLDLCIYVDGEIFRAREEQEDMYASIDLGVDKLRQQLRSSKDTQAEWRRAALSVPAPGAE